MNATKSEVVREWGYCIWSRWDGYEESSLALTKDRAWEKFCYPALRREAYECKGSGYIAKRVVIERVKINGNFIKLARRVTKSSSVASQAQSVLKSNGVSPHTQTI